MKCARFISALLLLIASLSCQGRIKCGADRPEAYLPLLQGQKVAVLSNQSGILLDGTHIVDALLAKGVDVRFIMCPEHGFRGTADAGERVGEETDPATRLPVHSLFGGRKRPEDLLEDIDVVLFDLQDVGCRFYTYYITMMRVMEACARKDKLFVVLDRPNPLGYYVDGPILEDRYRSGVGAAPIPVVHGMTLGELAVMCNGEGWLRGGLQCRLEVIACKGYTHSSRYVLPVRPSPNLPDMRSIYLYPSTCYFEATDVSLGRGTDTPFQIYGHPDFAPTGFSFTPRPREGAKNPPQKDRLCHGIDLRTSPSIKEIDDKGIDLSYIIDAWERSGRRADFFTPFFEKLIGAGYVREMILEGKSAGEIEAVWEDDVASFKELRKQYLLYPL